MAGCPCEACTRHTRAYLHYLARSKELTAVRLLTMHNLTFMAQLMNRLRAGVEAGDYERVAAGVLSGCWT
jgi:queuine tRNA-ribosyltransferase